jgi:hypothetical protein
MKKTVTVQDRVAWQATRVLILYLIGSDADIGMRDLARALRDAGHWKPKGKKLTAWLAGKT